VVTGARLAEIRDLLAATTPGIVRGGSRGLAFGEDASGAPLRRFWFDEASPHRPTDCSDPDLALMVAAKAHLSWAADEIGRLYMAAEALREPKGRLAEIRARLEMYDTGRPPIRNGEPACCDDPLVGSVRSEDEDGAWVDGLCENCDFHWTPHADDPAWTP